jgi:heterodisulfide reductase subunit B
MKVDIPLKIKLSFVAFDEYSRCEVSDTGSKNRLDLTLKVLESFSCCIADVVELRRHLQLRI